MFGLIPAFVLAMAIAQPARVAHVNNGRTPTATVAAVIAASPQFTSIAPPISAAGPQISETSSEARPRSGRLTMMYVAFATLQAMDAHSTLSALSNGGREANPVMRGVAGNPGALIAVKAATGATTIWLTERVRKKHPRGAVVLMAILNSALATVVAHNYSIR
jgi:hypothetical protein